MQKFARNEKKMGQKKQFVQQIREKLKEKARNGRFSLRNLKFLLKLWNLHLCLTCKQCQARKKMKHYFICLEKKNDLLFLCHCLLLFLWKSANISSHVLTGLANHCIPSFKAWKKWGLWGPICEAKSKGGFKGRMKTGFVSYASTALESNSMIIYPYQTHWTR